MPFQRTQYLQGFRNLTEKALRDGSEQQCVPLLRTSREHGLRRCKHLAEALLP